MVRSCSAGSPRTISPPTAPQPKPSTESCIPVRPKTRNCIDVPPTDCMHTTPNYRPGQFATHAHRAPLIIEELRETRRTCGTLQAVAVQGDRFPVQDPPA